MTDYTSGSYFLDVRLILCQQPANPLAEVETVKDANTPPHMAHWTKTIGKLGEQRLMDLDFKLMFPTLDARRRSHRRPPTHLHRVKEYAPRPLVSDNTNVKGRSKLLAEDGGQQGGDMPKGTFDLVNFDEGGPQGSSDKRRLDMCDSIR